MRMKELKLRAFNGSAAFDGSEGGPDVQMPSEMAAAGPGLFTMSRLLGGEQFLWVTLTTRPHPAASSGRRSSLCIHLSVFSLTDPSE